MNEREVRIKWMEVIDEWCEDNGFEATNQWQHELSGTLWGILSAQPESEHKSISAWNIWNDWMMYKLQHGLITFKNYLRTTYPEYQEWLEEIE